MLDVETKMTLAIAQAFGEGLFWWAPLYEGPGWIEAGRDLVCDSWVFGYRCECNPDGVCRCLRSHTEYHQNGSFLCLFCGATMWHRPCDPCRETNRGPFCEHRFSNL